jgi:GTPase SAR1 family protein
MERIDHPAYEIKVAVLGYVSVGKTTVLNALLRDKYGEVAMRRTTAAVNYFRISTSTTAPISPNSTNTDGSAPSSLLLDARTASWTMVPTEEPRPAQATLAQITADNERLRNATEDDPVVVEEVWFDIELDQPLLPLLPNYAMRDDTKLVLVDIPGLNEAGSSSKYKDHVDRIWHTFDVVLLVMDGRQGVITEEQVELLRFARDHQQHTKNIPVIVLSNKIDDPNAAEQRLLTMEAQKVVAEIFATIDQDELLQLTMEEAEETDDRGSDPFPNALFIPVSAMHAFIYQAGPRLNLDQFAKLLDQDLIDKIGKENYGFGWRRMTDPAAKIKAAHEAVTQVEMRQEGLAVSNFDTFYTVLSYCIGGKMTQAHMVQQQINVALARLAAAASTTNDNGSTNVDLAAEIETAYYNAKGLGMPTAELVETFWQVYRTQANKAVEAFTNVASVALLARPVTHLVAYNKFVHEVGLVAEQEKIVVEAVAMINRQADALMKKLEKNLSPRDRVLVYGSLLLLANQSFFIERFGLLKILLESKLHRSNNLTQTPCKCPDCHSALSGWQSMNGCDFMVCSYDGNHFLDNGSVSICPLCSSSVDQQDSMGSCDRCGHKIYWMTFGMGECILSEGTFSIADTTVLVPASVKDPDHFGHLIWLFGTIIQYNQFNGTVAH